MHNSCSMLQHRCLGRRTQVAHTPRARSCNPTRHTSTSRSAAQKAATTVQHIILAPPANNTAPPETETLLIIAPGFGPVANDFKTLGECVQAQSPDVRLWVACMDVNYQAIMNAIMEAQPGTTNEQAYLQLPSSKQLEDALLAVKDAAAAEGFKPRQAGWGRCTNMYLCAQSVAGVTMSGAAFKSMAGLILLGSAFEMRYSLAKLPSLEDWGRPVMLLGGELDGQMRWPWLAGLAADAAVLAQKAGPRFAAAHQPFVLVPGANHGSTSNGVTNFDRGDIPPQIEYAAATDAFAKAIAAFVTAHEGSGKSCKQVATDELLLMVRQTAELIGPYFMASGMGDICAAWVTGRQAGPESTASLDAPDTTHHTHPTLQHHTHSHPSSPLQQTLLQGTRREAGVAVSAALHPGVLQKAERFVAAAQLRLASTLPRIVLGKLRIVVQTHTTVEALLYNQPLVQEQDDGSVVVLVHALVALPNLVRPIQGAGVTSRPAAPEYWLKLKRPQAIAEALGLSGTFADGTTAAALNQGALDAALAAVAPATAARYKGHGWQLLFTEDESIADTNAEKFIRGGCMKFESTPAGESQGASNSVGSSQKKLGVITVKSPVLTSKSISETIEMAGNGSAGAQAEAMLAATKDPYMHRFLGNWYSKVMSVAQAMEWAMLDSLRRDNTWS